MKDLDMIERFLRGEDPRTARDESTPPPEVTARTRARLDEAIRNGGRSVRRPLWQPAIGVGLAAIATAAAIVVPALSTDGSDPAASPPATSDDPADDSGDDPVDDLGDDSSDGSGDPAARRVLLTAADEAARAEAETGRYWKVTEYVEERRAEVGPKSDDYTIKLPQIHETWTAPDAEDGSWEGHADTGWRPQSPMDKAAWVRDGSPRSWKLGPADTPGGKDGIATMEPGKPEPVEKAGRGNRFLWGDLGYVTSEGWSNLPTDPDALRGFLAEIPNVRDDTPADLRVFDLAVGLLAEAPVSPDVRAAAFRMLADLPGIVNNDLTQDQLGRQGVALSIEREGWAETVLVIDDYDGRLLEIRQWGIPNPTTTTYVAAEWTDQKPHAPSLSDFPR